MEKKVFCTECRKIVDFYITNETVEREIKGKFYIVPGWKIKLAKIEEIEKVKGINKALAEKIKEMLN